MDCAPHLLELPLHLGVLTFGGIMIGMSGSDIRFWYVLRRNLAEAGQANVFSINDNGLRMVDLAVLVMGGVSFVWGAVCIALAAKQFKGRKGNYTGEGTAGWLPVSLIYLLILGAWTGVVSAYTAYSNLRTWSISPGSAYNPPFSQGQQLLLYNIGNAFYTHYPPPLYVPQDFSQTGISASQLAPWNETVSTDQVNSKTLRFIRYQFYKAMVIVLWFNLAIVFTATVVHIAMPFVLRCLGWTRRDKRAKEAHQLESTDYNY